MVRSPRQRQRIEEAGHAQLVGQQAPAQGLRSGAVGYAVQRLHGHVILLARTVQRKRSHGLVAGAFGVVSGTLPMACAAGVVGEGFERVFAVGLVGTSQQRGFDALMQSLPFAQADGIVHRIAGDAMLETQSAARGVGVEKIRIRQRSASSSHQARRRRPKPADQSAPCFPRPPLHAPRSPGPAAAAPRREATSVPTQPCVPRPSHESRLPARYRMAKLFNEQRYAAGIIVDAGDQERVGLGQPAPHGKVGFRPLERIERDLQRAGNLLRAVIAGPAGQNDARALRCAEQRFQQLTAGVVGPLPVIDHEHQRALGGDRREEGKEVADQEAGSEAAAACFGIFRYQSKDRFGARTQRGERRLQRGADGFSRRLRPIRPGCRTRPAASAGTAAALLHPR